jgi:serine/threonine protein phosphatase PrpC
VPMILVEAVGRTHPGRRRQHNEDAFLELPEKSLYVIADGMGGYAAGEVASQLAVDVIAKAYESDHFEGERDRSLPRRGDELVRAIRMANLAILEQARANEEQAGMGTTIVAARFSPNRQKVYISHVGDSRAYRIRKGELKQMTIDHTLGTAGIVGPSAAKLSRAVGIGEEVDVDLLTDSPLPGDLYMLCCDGLNKMLPDEMMREILLREGDIDHAASALIDAANARGGRDNITVILIRVDEPASLRVKSAPSKQS